MFYDVFMKLCENKGVTPAKVAKETGINPQTISMWKTQGSTPNSKTMAKIAEYFDVSVRFLLGGDEKENQIKISTNQGDLSVRELEYISASLQEELLGLKQKMDSLAKSMNELQARREEIYRQAHQVETLIAMMQRATNGSEMQTISKLAETFLDRPRDGADH